MKQEYQITLFSTTGSYKPVSTIIKCETITTVIEKKKAINEGIKKIAQKRLWTNADLKKFGYTSVKIREYDKERIEKEKAEQYKQLKEEKYNSGEWKRPINKKKA